MSLEGCAFDDVLLKPQLGVLASRKDADISVKSFGLNIPLIAAPMPSVASTNLIREITRLGGMGVVHRMNRTEEQQISDYENSYVHPPVAIGLDEDIPILIDYGVKSFVLDVAHAHSSPVLDLIREIKKRFPEIFLTAGNIATSDGAFALAEAGADAIKVGIGPGHVCTTRQVTGFGVPQLQAIEESSRIVRSNYFKREIPVIADGGIRNSGDIVKALAAGADAVMIGSLFARSIEAGNGGVYWGNASSFVNNYWAPEGMHVNFVEPPEPLEDIVKRLSWGIRSGISYAGATNIAELRENAEWIRISDAGRKESKL